MLQSTGHAISNNLAQVGEVPSDPKKIGYLVKDEDRPELEAFLVNFPSLADDFIPVSIIGEGTFSTVYKAIDVQHYERDNSAWIVSSRQDPLDVARLLALVMAMEQAVPTRAKKKMLNTRLNQRIRDFVQRHYHPQCGEQLDLEEIRNRLERMPPQFVAIKRINATSGPKRIADEIGFLRDLQGQHGVVPVITAYRHEDQVIVVFPFFHSIDFRDLLVSLTINHVAAYMRQLLDALAHVHSHQIIHRDVKPSNFLFTREPLGQCRGILVDFGLAQKEETEMNAKTACKRPRTGKPEKISAESTERLRQVLKSYPPGYIINDPRQPLRASRAGTRGFRAPEVLYKVSRQTSAIDMWSAGVILLTLLTRRYPFFQSSDDMDALVELACIFGNNAMKKAAEAYDRIWKCTVPSVPDDPVPWRTLCPLLNGNWSESIPDEALDLLDKLLDLDYRTRITAKEALQHPFLLNH